MEKTQSEMAITNAMDEFIARGFFKDLKSDEIREIKLTLGQIALAGSIDAKNAAVNGMEQMYSKHRKDLFK